ncbi:hypothetical protein NDU88_003495, partial [Pleurodeles waltl]
YIYEVIKCLNPRSLPGTNVLFLGCIERRWWLQEHGCIVFHTPFCRHYISTCRSNDFNVQRDSNNL